MNNIKQIFLEKFYIAQSEILDDVVIHNFKADLFKNILDKNILILKGFVLGEQLEHVVIKYPINWIQAFKERWFPMWLLRKFPVKYKVYDVDFRVTYPKYNVALPNENKVYKLIMNEYEETNE